ncbi:Bug family tripartite tricarboxylate transporter substrate binding protein [Candidimonas nitroreducens]|nr:tripartite tricarboxylate transporter substrate binding protein [Candidimonas nitroreducens]
MRALIKAFYLMMAFVFLPSAWAGAYPDKPIRLIVPYAAGGATDVLARMLAMKMGALLKQPIIVVDQAGAGGTIGAANVAHATPDGYTLLFGTSSTQAINPVVYSKLSYDAVKDFAPITTVAMSDYALVVPGNSPYKTIGELLHSKSSKPLRYASNGVGTTSHLASALLAIKTGLNVLHIPYRASAPAENDLMGGQVDFLIDNSSTAVQNASTGKLRILATTGAERGDITKNIPTLAEAGVKGYEIVGWWMLVAPKGTPDNVLEKLHSAAVQAMKDPEVAKRMKALGASPTPSSSEDAQKFVASELKKFKDIAAAIHLQLD